MLCMTSACVLESAKELPETYHISGNVQMHPEHREKHLDPNGRAYFQNQIQNSKKKNKCDYSYTIRQHWVPLQSVKIRQIIIIECGTGLPYVVSEVTLARYELSFTLSYIQG